MPMLPSASSTCSQVPSPGSGPSTSRRTIGTPRRRQCRAATADTSTPSAGTPRAASAARSRPGPHPRSTAGPRQRSRSHRSSPAAARRHRRTARSTSSPSSRTSRAGNPARASSKPADSPRTVARPPAVTPHSTRESVRMGRGQEVGASRSTRDSGRIPRPRPSGSECDVRGRDGGQCRDGGGETRPGRLAGDDHGVRGRVDVDELRQQPDPQPRRAQRRDRPLPGVVPRGRHVGDHRGGTRVAQPQRPPPAVGGRSEDGVDGAVPQRCGGLGQQVRVDLRGVHAELHHRTAGQQGRGVAGARRRSGVPGPDRAEPGSGRRAALRPTRLPGPPGPGARSARRRAGRRAPLAPRRGCPAAPPRPGRRPGRGSGAGTTGS